MEEKNFLSAMIGNEYGINVEQNNNSQNDFSQTRHKNYIASVKIISSIVLIICIIGGLILSMEAENLLFLIITCIVCFLVWSVPYGIACIVENTEKHNNKSKYEKLERLQKLKKGHSITEEEFEQEKKKILNS